MERVHPHERFSQSEKSKSTPAEVLRESLVQYGRRPEDYQLTKLSGGFMNANFLAEGKGERFLLRVNSTGQHFAEKEHDLLKFLEGYPVKVPKALACFEALGQPVVVMEFFEGVMLQERLLSSPPQGLAIYERIGRELGEIHNIRFAEAGFICPKMKVGGEFENFSLFLRQFIEKVLGELEAQPERLDLDLNLRLRRLVNDKWDIPMRTEPVRQLTHCDFNPKNILVSLDADPVVTGVVDWDFADSGNGLLDTGNFFRFFYDYPSEAKAVFVKGYRAVNSSLPDTWEDASRLLDIANMCSFLERKEDYQKSFRTARIVIQSTLEHFGY